MNILSSISELLTHIREVEQDTIKMSQDSMIMLTKFIENNNIELDDNATTSLQYQDIISQQLTATIEAIDSVQSNLELFENLYKVDNQISTDAFADFNKKLLEILDIAKDRRDSFSGKLGAHDQKEIEFF
ncbi:MAG: hypothetical protein L3J10_00775 [Sulfurimonas sp.]|nr:hypothetical protein [Sulfurimonas sp.]